MKKIIVTCFVLFLGLLGYSSSAYLNSDKCSSWLSSAACTNGVQLVPGSCTDTDWTIYFQYRNSSNTQKTWSVSQCVWQTYWTWKVVHCTVPKHCCPVGHALTSWNNCKPCNSFTTWEALALSAESKANCVWECNGEAYSLPNWLQACCQWTLDENGQCNDSLSEWITINTRCLLNGQCGMNAYKVFWIRKSNENPTVMGFFQDIVLASTTAFLWTVVVIALVVSGLLFAFASITWKDTKRAKSILIDTFVWMLLVMWSYVIIRLIQFVATAWS